MCGIALVLTSTPRPAGSCNSPSSAQSPTYSPPFPDSSHGSHASHPIGSTKFDHELERRLRQRGPDHFQRLIRRLPVDSSGGDAPNDWTIAMHSAVLHLRGGHVVPQPVQDSADNVLCWNGEVFGMDGNVSTGEEERLLQGSDTVFLFQKLQSAGEKLVETTVEDPVVQVLRQVKGPFAVSWLHERTKRLYFAHDRFGRRSLLYRRWGDDESVDLVARMAGKDGAEMKSKEFLQTHLARFVLSSVAIGGDEANALNYQELPASGIYVLDLRARRSKMNSELPSYRMEFHPYAPLVASPTTDSALATAFYVFDRFGSKLPSPMSTSEAMHSLQSSACSLLTTLSDAVGVRVRSIPAQPSSDGISLVARVAVLFSGGLDSVVIAALSHFHLPLDEPVDLLTVCFDENSSFASPDRRAAELAHAELCELFPDRQWNLVNVNVPRTELASTQQEVQTLMSPCDTQMDFNIGAAFWFLSRGRGHLTNSAQIPENATLDELNAFLKPQRAELRELETKVAALALFDEKSVDGNTLLCPVRRCGRKRKPGCMLGVCKSCCFKMQRAVKKIGFQENDDGMQHANSREMQGCRAMLISMGVQSEAHIDLLVDLLRSKQQENANIELKVTVELCCRVHRAKQKPVDAPTQTATISTQDKLPAAGNYQTSARVVLVGIGADEQLAGYGRHRTALINGGEEALRAELQVDLGRIWKRNLGRDDRCIASHGREARFPYLDENVVSTIATFPVSSLCDAELPRGVGDKRALRVVAKTLGLRSCAGLAKRAIQFGSRIAKVSSTGSNRQTQGMHKFASLEKEL